MLKNLVRAERKCDVWHELAYDDGANNGFGFPCDAEGNPDPDMPQAAKENLAWCKAHPEKFVRAGKVITLKSWYTEPAHGTCVCGREVELYDEYYGSCRCECGRWYNLFGQELRPPEDWEDDPNESDAWDGYEPVDYGPCVEEVY